VDHDAKNYRASFLALLMLATEAANAALKIAVV
jgi:hypothetical protein